MQVSTQYSFFCFLILHLSHLILLDSFRELCLLVRIFLYPDPFLLLDISLLDYTTGCRPFILVIRVSTEDFPIFLPVYLVVLTRGCEWSQTFLALHNAHLWILAVIFNCSLLSGGCRPLFAWWRLSLKFTKGWHSPTVQRIRTHHSPRMHGSIHISLSVLWPTK